MKHATPETLASHQELLEQIRASTSLTERKPGTFYRKSSAILHFHEDPAGLFADLKINGEWHRFIANTDKEQAILLANLQVVSTEVNK